MAGPWTAGCWAAHGAEEGMRGHLCNTKWTAKLGVCHVKGDVLEVSRSAYWMGLVGLQPRRGMGTLGLEGAVEEKEEKPLHGSKPAPIKSPSMASSRGIKCKT